MPNISLKTFVSDSPVNDGNAFINSKELEKSNMKNRNYKQTEIFVSPARVKNTYLI